MTHILKKTISISFAIVLCCSTIKPTIAQPVPVLALPLVSNPVGLVFVSTVVVGGVIWYIYQDRHHRKFRSRVRYGGNVHKIEPGRHNVGDIVYPGEIVNSREECQRVAREYGERTDGGEWEVIDYIRLGQVHDGVSDPEGSSSRPVQFKCVLRKKK